MSDPKTDHLDTVDTVKDLPRLEVVEDKESDGED